MNIIFVNATALTSGGGLVTLEQFILNIPIDFSSIFYIFCSDLSLQKKYKNKNIKYIYPEFKKGIFRVYWDFYGLNKWAANNKIKPDLVISLQNTTINFDNDTVPQISYVMQAIPFVERKWSLFKKAERSLWFYKNIYPFFMSTNLGKKHYVVTQSKWIEREFIKKFKFPKERACAIRPVIEISNCAKKIKLNNEDYNIFCPSSAFVYKNNIEIANAIAYLKLNGQDISRFKIHITINKNDDPVLSDSIMKNKLSNNFNFIGRITYENMLAFYNSSDLVVFPSYIETFGLPLLEAASFGRPIIVSNESYAQEVISKYKGAKLIDINSPQKWGDAIMNDANNGEVYDRYKADFKESWEDLFMLINRIIKKESMENVQK